MFRHTWTFRSMRLEHVLQVPSTAVVCPDPLGNTGPETSRIALSSSVGYPAVLISWFGEANVMGAWIRYVSFGQS